MICIIMATRMEAEPFITGLELEKEENPSFHIYRRGELVLLVSGVGKMNASMTTTFAIDTFSPDCILNLGAAGSLGDISLGAVFQIKSIVESDRPLRHLNDKPRLYTPQTLDITEDAILATQDIPVIDLGERQELAKAADLVDMEGCAVAHVCKRFKMPCYLFKYVTDNMQNPEISDIVENIENYRDSFFEFCTKELFPAFKIL